MALSAKSRWALKKDRSSNPQSYDFFFSGTAFKTQKEVVKAIFVNNIEKLGHHYARVFDESW